jgi:perosamine synthetase
MNNNRFYYAGPLGISLEEIFKNVVGPSRKMHFHGRQVVFTHKGRGGLGLLCRHWNLNAGHEILMPAYNCGTEIDPFVYYGLKVSFYKINRETQIDIDDLKSRVTSRTKVIYVIHYFGWPQNIERLSRYCREKDIFIIEDCALSLFSNPKEQAIGAFGDAAIYSLPKSLPVPDGGVLTMPVDVPSTKWFLDSPQIEFTFKKMLPLIKRSVLRFSDAIGVYHHLPKKIIGSRNSNKRVNITPSGLPEIPKSYYYNIAVESKNASVITKGIFRHSCPELIVKKRRTNYNRLFDTINKSKLMRPLFHKLPEEVCPLCFPALAENRNTICNRLNDMGIDATQWWSGYHRAFDWADYPDSKYLKDHVLAIPIHQQITYSNIEYICSSISNLCK